MKGCCEHKTAHRWFAADNETHGCTLSVLVSSGVKPKKKIMNTFVLSVVNYFRLLMYVSCPKVSQLIHLASFPGPARSSLVVRNSCRGPGLVHHVMCATAYVTAISLKINDVIG